MKDLATVILGMILLDTLGGNPWNALSAQTLGDRLIVEVNRVPYTQSQVEGYLVVKWCLRSSNEAVLREQIEPANWAISVESFVDDMVVHQEASKLGSFQPTVRMIETSLEIFAEKREKYPIVGDLQQRLGLSKKTISRNSQMVLRIQAYLRNLFSRHPDKSKTPDNYQKPKWLQELRERASVRFFDGALRFRQVQPSQGQVANAL